MKPSPRAQLFRAQLGSAWLGLGLQAGPLIGEMWDINPTSHGSLFNYPKFPEDDDSEIDINDRLSFIVPTTKLEVEGPYEFTGTMYPDDRQREFLRWAMVIEPSESDHCLMSVPQPSLRLDKGKQRATDPYTVDDIDCVPEGMPPWQIVNHEIPLIDDDAKYHYHLPWCPNALRRWWELTSASQAAPMMCIFKKDTHLCTMVDCQQWNKNKVKDVTPMPDQDNIREDVTRAMYRSKIDLSDAYEQLKWTAWVI
ncbi:hypothetical protein ARMGADRAFT_1035876 [Armillaria gallica]|uniref:Reverse transcriptase domain-containing protein n=1 Tax=Armillaria gallica TaxID=47427 RepID=A0A2H3CT04_ARMGA|nr:hypothetical protein ARMGADRAFT_1035876 [Armillaria gallica]